MTEASVSFAGNLTEVPEVHYTEAGIARAMFRVAVSGRRDQAIAAALDELVQAAANLPAERPAERPSGTLVARNRRAKSDGPGRRAGGGR